MDQTGERDGIDGNLLQTKIHNLKGNLVGVDKFGNKYYENRNYLSGRHKWVEYAFVQLLMLKPKRYGLEHTENFSGEGEELIYHSKGYAFNKGQRDWTRYQPWERTKP